MIVARSMSPTSITDCSVHEESISTGGASSTAPKSTTQPQHVTLTDSSSSSSSNSTTKKSVTWPDLGGSSKAKRGLAGKKRAPPTRLFSTKFIDERCEWDADERAAYWYTDQDYDDIKSSLEFTIFMMDAGTPSRVNDNLEYSTRGLERKTQDGKWERYELRRNNCHAVLDEVDRQREQTCGRRNGGNKQQSSVTWEWNSIAAIASEQSLPSIQQARERGLQDYQDLQHLDNQMPANGALEEPDALGMLEVSLSSLPGSDINDSMDPAHSTTKKRIGRTISEATAETVPLSDDAFSDEEDGADESNNSHSDASRGGDDPLFELLHDLERDDDDEEPTVSCLDLTDRSNGTSDKPVEENDDEPLVLCTAEDLASLLVSKPPPHQANRSRPNRNLSLPTALFSSLRDNNLRTNIQGRSDVPTEAPEVAEAPEEDMKFPSPDNRWEATASSEGSVPSNISTTLDSTNSSTGRQHAPTPPRRKKSNDDLPLLSNAVANDRPRPTRATPKRTTRHTGNSHAPVRPQRRKSSNEMTPPANAAVATRRASLPGIATMVGATQLQPPSAALSEKDKYIIVDATCKPMNKQKNSTISLPPKPAKAPLRRKSLSDSLDYGTDDNDQPPPSGRRQARRHSISTVLDARPVTQYRPSTVETPRSKAFPFAPLHLQDDLKPASSPWAWKPSVLDQKASSTAAECCSPASDGEPVRRGSDSS